MVQCGRKTKTVPNTIDRGVETMKETRDFLRKLGLPAQDAFDLPTSSKRFPDGARYRIEIPSVVGPQALRAVLEEAEEMVHLGRAADSR